MIPEVPSFVDSSICLKCDGCCRFSYQNSEWRPKADSEDMEMYVDCIDDRKYIQVEVLGDICKCIFLNLNNNECRIYNKRPFECKLYPFLLVNNKGKYFVAAHLSCPFLQENIDKEEFNAHLFKLQTYFHRGDIKDFIRENLSLAGEYSEYKDEIRNLFEVIL